MQLGFRLIATGRNMGQQDNIVTSVCADDPVITDMFASLDIRQEQELVHRKVAACVANDFVHGV